MSYQTLVQSDRIAYATQQGATLNQIAIITADIPSRSTIYFANSNIFKQDGTLDTSQAVLAIDVYNKTVRVGDYYISSGTGVSGAQLISTTTGIISGGGPLGILQLASTAIGVNDQSYHYNFDLLSTIAGQYVTFGPQIQTGLSTVALFTSNTSNYYKNSLVDYSSPISTISASVTATSNYLKTLSPDISTPISSLSTAISQTSNWSRGILKDWSTPVSTVALFTSNTSNWAVNLNQNWSSAVSIATLYTSNTSNWSRGLLQDYSTPVSTVALFTSNTSNWAVNLNQNWSSAVSTATLFTSNTSNYYKNTVQDYSTSISTLSTYTGTTSNYFIANAGGSGTSSLLGVISSGFSTLAIYTSTTSNWSRGLLQDFSTPVSTVSTAAGQTSNWARGTLQDWSTQVCTVAVYASNTSNWSRGMLQDWSTPITTATQFTTNTSNWAKNAQQDWSTPVSSISTVAGATSNYYTPLLSNNYSTNLQSTVTGLTQSLGSAGYISTASFLSSMLGITSNISSMIDPVELASSIVGLGTVGFVSAIGLTAIMNSTVAGVNFYVSSMIDPVELTSSIVGLGASGFISTVGLDTRLASTVFGVNSNMYSTTSGTSTQIANVYQFSRGFLVDFSTPVSSISTVTGLTSNYFKIAASQDISTPISSLSTTYGYAFTSLSASVSTLTLQNLGAAVASISSLQVNALTIGTGTGIISLGDINTVSISSISTTSGAFYGTTATIQSISAQQIVASSFRGDGSQLQNTAGLSTVFNYARNLLQDFSTPVSSVSTYTAVTSNWAKGMLQDWSTPIAVATQYTTNTSNWAKNMLQDYSTPISSVIFYTKNILQDWSTPVSTISTTTGQTSNWSRVALQDWSTPVSTVALYTSNTSNWASNIQQNWSSAVSIATLYTSNTSNWAKNAQQDWSTPVSTVALYASNTSNWASNIQQNWSSAVSIATLYTSNTSNWSKNMLQDYSTPISSVIFYTKNILQDWSTPVSSVSTAAGQTSNWSRNMLQDYSTPISSVIFYTKNILQDWSTPVSSVSTTAGQTSNWSRNMLQDYSTPISSVIFYTKNILQDFSTPVSSVSTAAGQTSNWSRGAFQDWSTPVSSLSTYTGTASNWSRGILQDWSTPVNTVTLYTQNTSNWARGILVDWSTPLSTATLYTSNTSNYYAPLLSNNYSTNLQSTVAGLGSATYISASQLYSTVAGITFSGSTNTLSAGRIFTSSINAAFVTGTQGYISSLVVDSLAIGSNSGFINMGDIITTSHSTLQINTGVFTASGTVCTPQIVVSSINGQTLAQLATVPIQSTAIGLGTLGYISTATFLSSMLGITSNISSMIDPVELASSIVGLGTVGFVSSIGLTAIMNSTVAGVNLYVSSMIDPIELTSTITGLGASGFISTVGLDAKLASTVQGLGTAGYVSSLSNVTLVSTLGLSVSSINGIAPNAALTGSTLALSTGTVNTSNVNVRGTLNMSNNAITNLGTATITSLDVNLVLWFDASDLTTLFQNFAGTTPVTATGQSILAWRDKSSYGVLAAVASGSGATTSYGAVNGYNVVAFSGSGSPLTFSSANIPSSSSATLTIFMACTGTDGGNRTLFNIPNTSQISITNGGQLRFGIEGLNQVTGSGNSTGIISGTISAYNLNLYFQGAANVSSTSFPVGAGTGNGTIGGGGYGNFSGSVYEILIFNQVLTTTNRQIVEGYLAWKWGTQTSLTTGHPYKPPTVLSGPAYTPNPLGSLTAYGTLSVNTSNTKDFQIAATNTLRFTSPTEWRYITSSVAGSSLDLTAATSYFATTYRLTGSATVTITFPALTAGAWWTFINAYTGTQVLTFAGTTTGLTTPYSLLQSASITIYSDGTSYYLTTAGSPFTGSTIYISATTVQAQTLSTLNLNTSSINGQTLAQIAALPIQSTVVGLATAGYISSTQLASTQAYLLAVTSTGLSSVALFTSNTSNWAFNLLQDFSTPRQSTTIGLGTLGYISSSQLASTQAYLLAVTSSGLSSISTTTGQTSNWARNLLQDYSTPVSTVGLFTSNTSNWARNLLQDYSTPVSTVGLFTSNTSNWARNMLQDYSTPVSSISTVTGLTSNYFKIAASQDISTPISSLSTTYGYAFTSLSASISTLTLKNFTSLTGSVSSLQVNSLLIGTGTGSINLGDTVMTAVSSVSTATNTLYALNTLLGNVSSQTAIQFYGLTGQYNGTAIAEKLVSPGVQELLLYKASSIQDQIRLQTTGNIVFEAGVASRSWSTSTAAATPTLYISYLSNVGIGTAAPATTLDVAGTGRFQAVSTLALVTSSINGQTVAQLATLPIQSTVIGLGTAGYISSTQLASTQAYLLAVTSTGLSTVALFTSNTSNYARGFIQDFSTPVSSVSTVAGLTSNWSRNLLQDYSTPVSTVALFTSNTSNYTRNLLQDWSTPVSTVALFTSNTSNYARNILQDWSTATQSTVAGLGTATYISATQLYSTVAGITFSGSTNTLSASRIFTSSLNAAYVTSVQGYISSLVIDSLQLGFNNAFFEMGDVIATSLSTLQVNTGILTTSGVICTPQIIVSTINGAAPVNAANITSTVAGLGTSGYVSSVVPVYVSLSDRKTHV